MKLFISFKNFEKKCSQWSSCGSEVAHWLYFATHSQQWPTSVLLSGLVLLTSANISLIFLKLTNVLHTSIERYVYRASAHFLLHQNQMTNRSLKIKFIYSLIPGLELNGHPSKD